LVGRERLLVLQRDLEACARSQSAELGLRLLSAEDLGSLELPVSHRQRIACALSSQDACYALIDHGRVVHHSIVSTKGRYRWPVDAELACPGGIYIYDCWTHEALRGRGTYPAVLEYLCALNRDRRRYALVDVWASNVPSVRGIQKAGFRLLSAFTVWRFAKMSVITTPLALKPVLARRRPIIVHLRRKEFPQNRDSDQHR